MPYYKSTMNKVHFLDDDGFSTFLPPGCVQISDAEADALKSSLTPEEIATKAQRAQDQADADEVKSMPFIMFLTTHRPAQIATRVQNDIATDGVEAVLIRLAKALSVLAKQSLR